MPRTSRPLAVAVVVLGLAAAVPAAAAIPSAAAPAVVLGPGASPNPASGLSLLRTVEAGHQAQPLPDGMTNGTPFQTDTTIEPSISVNPDNPLEIVTGFQSGRDDAGGGIDNGFATSHDGGLTWTVGAMPGLTATSPSPNTRYTRASDAVIAWGLGDTVYYSSLVFDPSGANLVSAIVNSTSTDGGLTWGLPDIVQDDDGAGLNDKNWVTVDRSSAAGHTLGRVYVTWDRVAGVFTKYSDDGGVTWVPPSPVVVPLTFQGQGIGAIPVVLPSGGLAEIFETETIAPPVGELELGEAMTGLSRFAAATAPLAGTEINPAPIAFQPAVAISTYQGTAVRGQRAAGLLDAEVDQATGRIYAVFESAQFRTDQNNDIVMTYSDDSGTTWTQPSRVNAGPTDDQVDHYDPSIAIGPDSSVRIMWRQRQENASADALSFSPYVSTWIAQSTDAATFAPALQVDRGTNDVRYGAFSRGGTFQGDYDEVVTVGDTSYLVYCDSLAVSTTDQPPATPDATTVHHQRAIVSIVRPAAAAAAPAPVPAAPAAPAAPGTPTAPVTPASGTLASTGLDVGWVAGGLALLGLGLVVRRRRQA